MSQREYGRKGRTSGRHRHELDRSQAIGGRLSLLPSQGPSPGKTPRTELVGHDLSRSSKDALMTMSAERRYRIIVAGGSARTLVDVIEGIELESCEAGWTCF